MSFHLRWRSEIVGGSWFLSDRLHQSPVCLHVLSIFEVLIPDIWDLRLFIIELAHHDKSLTECNFCQHISCLGILKLWAKYID